MLRRKPGAYEKRGPSRKEYANVVPLHATRYEAGGEFNAERLQKLSEKLERSAKRIVERHIDSPDLEDLAKLNDMVLRFFLKVPARTRESKHNREALFSKLQTAVSAAVLEKRQEAARELDRSDGDRDFIEAAQAKIRFLEDVALDLNERLSTLEVSVLQLARFVSSQSQERPGRVFATGINLDVAYGIDLIGAEAEYNKETGAMEIDLRLYQAKALKAGLDNETIQALPEEYQEQQEAGEQELEFDAEWVRKNLLERKKESSTVMDVEDAFEVLAGSQAHLVKMRKQMDQMTPAERYVAEQELFEFIRITAEDFGVDVPDDVTVPTITLRNIEVRYLVDAKDGTHDLSAEDAASFEAKTRQRPSAA